MEHLMNINSINRKIGSILLIVGLEIGGGILALPIIIASTGLIYGTVILLIAWSLMLYTGLLVCKANCALENNVGFATMANTYLGQRGKFVLIVVFIYTLSSIAMAYISGAGSTFSQLLHIPPLIAASIFVLLFGTCIIIGTKMVDYANRIFLGIKVVLLLIAIFCLLISIHPANMLVSSDNISPIISSIPAIVTAFTLHSILPSIRTYLKNSANDLRQVVIIASIIPLIIYFLWIFAIIGNIPHHGANSFDVLFAKSGKANVSDLLTLLSANSTNELSISAVYLVATISVTTSFLGTSLSMYNFIQDLFGNNKNSILKYKIYPAIVTFIIPLLVVFIYPNIFILALSYAGTGCAILFILLPIIIIKQMIKQGYNFSNTIYGNQIILNIAFCLGLIMISLQFWHF
jgi:amino acid permease